MRKPIILYSRQDPDLIALYDILGSKAFIRLVKDALRSLVRPGYHSEIPLPDGNVLKELPTDLSEKIHGIPVGLTFSENRDADVVSLLSKSRPRMCGNFIKQAVRFHIGARLSLSSFLTDCLETDKNPTQVIFLSGMPASPYAFVRHSDQTGKRVKKSDGISVPVKKEIKEEVIVKDPGNQAGFLSGGFPTMNVSETVTENASQEDEDMQDLLDSLLGDD